MDSSSSQPVPEPSATAVPRAERRLRRKLRDDEPLVAWGRAWVSREGRMHTLFAARTLDFVVLTDDSLIVFSTGFFSRRPRRRVYREPLDRLFASERRARRGRRIAIWTKGRRPLLLEMRDRPRNDEVADRLLEWIQRHEDEVAILPADRPPVAESDAEGDAQGDAEGDAQERAG
jgi:hypothetical protein